MIYQKTDGIIEIKGSEVRCNNEPFKTILIGCHTRVSKWAELSTTIEEFKKGEGSVYFLK